MVQQINKIEIDKFKSEIVSNDFKEVLYKNKIVSELKLIDKNTLTSKEKLLKTSFKYKIILWFKKIFI